MLARSLLSGLIIMSIASVAFSFIISQIAHSLSQTNMTASRTNSSSLSSPSLVNSSIPQASNMTLKGGGTFKTVITKIIQSGIQSDIQNDIQNSTNYIEGKFRIISENSSDSHAGIVWSDGNKDYYAFIRPSISRLSIYSPDKGEIFANINPPFVHDNWYILRIVFSNNSVNVILDNNLSSIHIPVASANSDVSNAGIRAYNSVAEFQPLKVVGTKLQTMPRNPLVAH